jgi:hypothetical protein
MMGQIEAISYMIVENAKEDIFSSLKGKVEETIVNL